MLILPESTMPAAKGKKQSAVLPSRDVSEQSAQAETPNGAVMALLSWQ